MTAVAAPRLPGHLPSTGDVGVKLVSLPEGHETWFTLRFVNNVQINGRRQLKLKNCTKQLQTNKQTNDLHLLLVKLNVQQDQAGHNRKVCTKTIILDVSMFPYSQYLIPWL